MPPKLQDIWDEDDHWAGQESAQERRKRQNRVYQRAYRRKRHLQRLGTAASLGNETAADPVVYAVLEYAPARSDLEHERQASLVKGHQSLLRLVRNHDIEKKVVLFLQKVTTDYSDGRLVIADLPILTRLNSFDALIRNAFVLNISIETLYNDCEVSGFCCSYTPTSSKIVAPPTLPVDLSPTPLQRSIRHHPWLDLFPMPKFRDNILEGISTDRLDEDDVSEQLICDLMNLDATSGPHLMIWGDPWDIRGWEFSPEFLVKWSHLLGGCDDMLQATNYWRTQRREMQLSLILN